MVEFTDGSIKAQLSPPDMRLPIQYALLYPERLPNNLPHLDLSKTTSLTFDPPDGEQFPCLNLALDASRKGGTYPTVLSTADELAVALFLEERISFTDIPKLVAEALEEHRSTPHPSLEDVLAADDWARKRMYG
jgi:1-deoxy-D-xylulose-5-phosphate reductoisomerase